MAIQTKPTILATAAQLRPAAPIDCRTATIFIATTPTACAIIHAATLPAAIPAALNPKAQTTRRNTTGAAAPIMRPVFQHSSGFPFPDDARQHRREDCSSQQRHVNNAIRRILRIPSAKFRLAGFHRKLAVAANPLLAWRSCQPEPQSRAGGGDGGGCGSIESSATGPVIANP
eukprot:GHVU01071405.1.p3 GENE.GHVU01071405.1~~GHVU01071405.1.p3  ORF type:complete len:173 (-),score=16.94 GHVU01071405.1:187-705(-)